METRYFSLLRTCAGTAVVIFSVGSIGADCGGTGEDDDDGSGGESGAAGQSAAGAAGAGGASGNVCADCMNAKCAAEIAGCGAGCQQLVACALPCGTDACIEDCKAQYPNDVPAAEAFVNCASAQCKTECSGGAGGAGTGGSAGGAAGDCAAAIKGCWVGPGAATKMYYDGVSQVNEIFYTPESGDIPNWGTYTCNDGVVSMIWSDGSRTGQLSQGTIIIGGKTFWYYGSQCP